MCVCTEYQHQTTTAQLKTNKKNIAVEEKKKRLEKQKQSVRLNKKHSAQQSFCYLESLENERKKLGRYVFMRVMAMDLTILYNFVVLILFSVTFATTNER